MPAWGKRSPAWLALPAFVLLLVCGCAGRNPHAIDDPLKLKRVSLAMAAGANGNRPARVELVRVSDERLAAELVATDTAAWFDAVGEAFRRANPNAVFDAWELVPGHVAGPVNVKADGKFAGVLFCDAEPRSAPFRLAPGRKLTVAIDVTGCRLERSVRKRSMFRVSRRSKSVDLSFAVGAAANGNRPLRVELVRAADADLVADLTRLSGAAWFGMGGQAFRRSHPDVQVDDWELVPGRIHGPFNVAVNGKVSGVLFCGPTHNLPLEVQWRRKLRIEIDGEGCRLAAPRHNSRWWGASPIRGAPQSRSGASLPLRAGFASGPATPTPHGTTAVGRCAPFGVCSVGEN